MQKPSVKILVAYHKPSALFKDEVLTPIHLGRALSKESHKDGKMSDEDFEWLCENMIGDDTGENISYLNRYFNEMTGIYWAWRNYDKLENPDYIGFMSYRRFFYFTNKKSVESKPRKMSYRCLNQNPKNKLLPYYNFDNFSEFYWNDKDTQEILNLTKEYDFITNLPNISKEENVEEQYKNTYSISVGHIAEDIERLKNIITQNFPQYKQKFEKYLTGNESYFSNMFIMKKELFFEYCEFIFPILFEYHKNTNYNGRNHEQKRMFISERLTGTFYQLLNSKNLNSIEIPLALVENPILTPKQINPAFIDNNIPIVFSVDKKYLPYLYVALSSIIENSNSNLHYDITILHIDIPTFLQQRLDNLKRENISIRFINISDLLGRISTEEQELFYISGHLDLSTYFRFFIPRLYGNYKKVIYLDVDMIILEDLSKLYAIDLEDKPLGAALDIGQLYDTILYPKQKKYVRETLKVQETNYFQAGLLVYNIPKCLEISFESLCIEKLKELRNPIFHDQDVLNSVFENKIKLLNLTWNLTWDMRVLRTNGLKCLPTDLYNAYQEAQKNPYIVHYCTYIKPWRAPHLPLADLWWNYARKTPFYEEFLIKLSTLDTRKFGAGTRVKNYLSYKLGSAMINAKTPLKALMLPIIFIALSIQHKIDRQIYKAMSRVNPSLALPPLSHYADYNQVESFKSHLSYRLGEAFLKNPLTFPFKIPSIYKDYRQRKENC